MLKLEMKALVPYNFRSTSVVGTMHSFLSKFDSIYLCRFALYGYWKCLVLSWVKLECHV